MCRCKPIVENHLKHFAVIGDGSFPAASHERIPSAGSLVEGGRHAERASNILIEEIDPRLSGEDLGDAPRGLHRDIAVEVLSAGLADQVDGIEAGAIGYSVGEIGECSLARSGRVVGKTGSVRKELPHRHVAFGVAGGEGGEGWDIARYRSVEIVRPSSHTVSMVTPDIHFDAEARSSTCPFVWPSR